MTSVRVDCRAAERYAAEVVDPLVVRSSRSSDDASGGQAGEMDDAPRHIFRLFGTDPYASSVFKDLSELLDFGLVGKRKSHLLTGVARLNPNGNRTPLNRGRTKMLRGRN